MLSLTRATKFFAVMAGLVLGLVALRPVQAGIVWIDPNNFANQQQITDPFVSLSALVGGTSQVPPDGNVYSLSYTSSALGPLQVFGWRTTVGSDPWKPTWRGKWAVLQAVFNDPVSYVAIDIYANDSNDIAYVLGYNSLGAVIWNEWVTLGPANFSVPYTLELSLDNPEIKRIEVSGVYVRKKYTHDIIIGRLGYSIEPIPEPSVMVLLAGGGAAAALISRLRRRRGK